MREFNCLDPKSNVDGHHFLEASAGTGKTFAIEHIVLRLLCEHGYELSEILAVTFTKAATRDLKTRISSTIRNAYQQLEKGDEHLFLRAEHLPFLEKALLTLQELEVYTLHGFCYQALMKNALYVGFPLQASSPDEMTHSNHVIQLVRDFFRTEIKPPRFSGIQFSLLLKKYDLQSLERKLVPLLTGNVELPKGRYFGEYQTAVTTFLSEVDRKKLVEDVNTLAAYYKGICSRDGAIKEEFASQLEFLAHGEDVESTLKWKKSIFSFFTPENEKVKGPPYRSLEIEKAGEIWGELFEEMISPMSIFSTLAFELRDWVQEKLGQTEVVTPDGILEVMRNASEVPFFKEQLRKQYRAVIIDEFQDTDPLQWEIFRNLFFSEEYSAPTLYLVGDPKQSIYSFRNADIYTYLKARDAFSELRSLSTNYRSNEGVIEGLNALFSHPEVAALPVPYVPVQVGGDHKGLDDGKKGVHFFSGSEQAALTYVVNEIVSLDSFAFCAVLVRDRFQAEQVRELLLKAGIPSVMRHQGVIIDSPVFSLVKYVCAVARDPFAMNEIKLLATHQLVGFTANDLVDESWSDIVRQFQSLHPLFKERGLIKTIDAFLHMELKGSSPIEQIVRGMQLELWGDYLQLMKLLYSGYSIEEIERLGRKGDEKVAKQPIHKEDAVTIMTMHLSKGLEFDVVFALGVSSRFMPKDPLLRHGNRMVRNEESEESKAALHEIQQEKLRQLYVALTRAKKRLYVPLVEHKESKSVYELSPIEVFLQGRNASILADLQNVISIESIEEEAIVSASPHEVAKGETTYLDVSFVKRKSALSFSALARPTVTHPVSVEESEIPPGSETGTFFHEAYERIIEEALYYPYDDARIGELVHKKAEYTPLEKFQGQILHILKQSFYCPLIGGKRLVDIPPEQLLPEVEFYYHQNEMVYKGVIDLLFCLDGRWYVLDWKTTLVGGYSEESLEQAMKDHDYFLQASMYAHAARELVSDFAGVYYFFLRGLEKGQGVFFYEA